MKLVMLGSGSYKSSLTRFRLVALGQELAKLGWQVSIIVPSADKYNDFTKEAGAKIDGIELVQPWQFATRSPLINLLPYMLTAAIATLRTGASLIYICKPTPITIVGLIPKLLFRTPIILDLDDLGSEVMRLQGQPKMYVKLVATCEVLALRYATAVVVTSTYLEAMVKRRYPNKPVLTLSNGVNPDEFNQVTQPPRNAIYYFGAIHRLNLIETFLRSLSETIAAVPDIRVTILGGGKALVLAKQLVQELNVADHVTFTDWIDVNDIGQFIGHADLAICTQPDIPTVRAASNLKVFQYMALGSVPVVSDVGDLKNYIDGDKPVGVAVTADDQTALSKALIQLLKNPTQRQVMAKRARRRAETVYAWSVLALHLNDFLRQQGTEPRHLKSKKVVRDV